MSSQSPLDLDQLAHVLDVLKLCNFPDSRWLSLGLRLGLLKTTLDVIKRDNATADDCLMECLSKWLSKADNVVSRGGPPTWDSLSAALRAINEIEVANNLNRELRMSIVNDSGGNSLQERVRSLSELNQQLIEENRALHSQISKVKTQSIPEYSARADNQSTIQLQVVSQPETELHVPVQQIKISESTLQPLPSNSRDSALHLDYVQVELVDEKATDTCTADDRHQQSLSSATHLQPATVGKAYDFLFKIIVLGDSTVGKSNLISQFAQKKFSFEQPSTVGMEFVTKRFIFDGETIKAEIWDTGGQERYRAITRSYYRGISGALLVYDITQRSSFDNAEAYWLQDLRRHANNDIAIMLIGNKCDLNNKRAVSTDEAEEFAMQHDFLFTETSACNFESVEAAFYAIFTELYHKATQVMMTSVADDDVISLHNPNENRPLRESKCCQKRNKS